MTGVRCWRFQVLLGVVAALLAVSFAAPAQAQGRGFFDSLFGSFPSSPSHRNAPSEPSSRTAPAADASRAPAPKRAENPPSQTVLVLGDSMADWLAYGLEEVLADTPEMGVVRKHRTNSGLIRYDTRNEALDWVQVARDLIASEKPNFVVVMLGLHDRQAIRERAAPARGAQPAPAPAATPATPPGEPSAEGPDQADPPPVIAAPEPAPVSPRSRTSNLYEFRSEKWAELYGKRIDDMMAALKSRNVPVLWVGLPSIRGPRSTNDMSYLNDLFRARAEKAGVVFIDTWDGFVDESGRFAVQGPDLEGQIRRLRAGDGVHFTRAGARKLAHYAEREITRTLEKPVAVALPTTEPQPQTPSGRPDGPTPRPLAGPVVPLTSTVNAAEELLGGSGARAALPHVTATRVLVKGEAVPPPAGRADDFAWPRRGVAPFGSDPVVASTTLPLPVMVAAPAQTKVMAPNAEPAPAAAVAPRRVQRQAAAPQPAQQQQRRTGTSPFPFFLPFLFR